MKKILFSLIFTICFCLSSVYAYTITDKINVGILYGSTAVNEINIKSSSDLILGKYNERDFTPLFSVNYDELKITLNSNVWHVQYSSGVSEFDAKTKIDELNVLGIKAFAAYSNGNLCVWEGNYANQNDALYAAQNSGTNAQAVCSTGNSLKAVRGENTIFAFSDDNARLGVKSSDTDGISDKITLKTTAPKEYRGGLCFYKLSESSAITVSNILDTEKYLYSVISKEMSPSWHKEALKAQAVCARNYAVTNRGKHNEYGFDVCSSVCCQAYSGTEAETSQSYAPVDETCGVFLKYNGDLALTVYSSSMGNSTENVKNVWGSDYPYLSSVSNEYEDTANIPNGVWEKSLTASEATDIMNNKGYNIGTVTSIEAIEYSDAGRVTKLKVTGTDGEKIFERESCRLAFSPTTMSQMYTISHGGETVDDKINILSENGISESTVSTVTVKSFNSDISSPTSLTVINGIEDTTYNYGIYGGDPNLFVFKGQGWGHGVGMSQYGAKGMAENGFAYDQILTHYFSGTTLEKCY